jgi:signal transduction histidine kinase
VVRRFLKSGTSQGNDLWPVLLLLIVVMVPTIGVLWFVSVAMRNEQLASRQRLSDAYHTHLLVVQRTLDDRWSEIADDIQDSSPRIGVNGYTDGTMLQWFVAAVVTGPVDAVVCFDDAGQIAYPTLPDASSVEFDDDRWREAVRIEYERGDPAAAQKIYHEIVAAAKEPLLRAFALQSEVRCLFRTGEDEAALKIVDRSDDFLSLARDTHGRLIAANVELMAIELAEESAITDAIRQRLLQRLDAHVDGRLPASQRLFLMKRLAELIPGSVDASLLAAEDLAARFVAAQPRPSRTPALQSSQLADVWQVATSDGRLLLLLKTETVAEQSALVIRNTDLPEGVQISIIPPGQSQQVDELVSIRAGSRLPGWRLSMNSADAQIDTAASHQQALHLWISVLVVLFTSAVAVFLAISIRRQIHVANLKNDLVGTVSHELKTPLSSMRLLVDTLLESSQFEPQQTREYLQLIAKENTRLSRLIENFLTFSRLEQGKHTFEFCAVEPAALIARAVEAAGERFHESGCTLTIESTENLPSVRGDEDGLVMALLNLLDNAYKYSSVPREISVRANREGDAVCFSVSDNGVGMTRAAANRIFQKFYQVDQSLVREGQGCGLGLSIVNDIVRAHGGEASVSSRPENGSTFTLRIPTATSSEASSK